MAVVQKSRPVAFGLGAGPAKLIKVGSGNEMKVHIQDARLSFSANSQEVMDGNGEVVGKVYFDNRRTLTMNLFISGTSAQDTMTQAEANFESDIVPGDKIVISWDEWNEVDADENLTGDSTAGEGQYVVDTCEKTRAQGQIAEWSITAIMYANDISEDAS
jgi:hypothetical protein